MKFKARGSLMFEADMIEIIKRTYRNFSIFFKNSCEVSELAKTVLRKLKKVQGNPNKVLITEKDIKNIKKIFFLSMCDVEEKKALTKENINEIIEEKINEEYPRLELIITKFFNDIIPYADLLYENLEKISIKENARRKNEYFSTLNSMKKELSNCKIVNDLVDKIYKFYLSGDNFTKVVSMDIMGTLCGYIVNYIEDLNNCVYPFKKCKKKIEKFIDDFENGKVVSADDAKEILNLYNIGDADSNDLAIEEEVKKHNDEVIKKEKLSKENTARLEICYETREERIARHNSKNIEYKDIGNVELTLEELECLDLYFSVIEELDEKDLEAFENRTTEFLPMLLDSYPNQLITLLIDKIQNSDINPQIKKRVCKAVKHLG